MSSHQWHEKSSLNPAEMEILDQIILDGINNTSGLGHDQREQVESSSLAQGRNQTNQESIQSQEANHCHSNQDIVDLLRRMKTEELEEQSRLLKENDGILTKINQARGLVTQTTLDFQNSCMAILNRQNMLTQVSQEISQHLKHYTDFEEIELEVDKWDDMAGKKGWYEKILTPEHCSELIELMLKIQDTVKFFKANLTEYKKAEVYLRRYENLRERVVTMVSNWIGKTIKEALQKINLRIAKNEGGGASTESSSFHVDRYFFVPEGHQMCKILMSKGLDNVNSIYQFDFSQETQAIYHEFFDSLNYIIEQAIQGILPQMDQISDYVGWHMQFMYKEREFFLKFFPDASIQRFDHFLSLNEYNWVGQRLLDKFEIKEDGDMSIAKYAGFIKEFVDEAKKVFRPETVDKLDSLCQEKLNGLAMRDLQLLTQEFQQNQGTCSELNEALPKISEIFEQIEPIMKIENYLTNVLEISSKLLNLTLSQIDLKHTDNIIEKFRFRASESAVTHGGQEGSDFDKLLRVYFELNYIQRVHIGSVDMAKYEAAMPRAIGMDHLESQPQASDAQADPEEGPDGGQGGGLLSDGLRSSLESQFGNLGEQLGTPDLAATFSFLGEQIWHFISLYNHLTLNNNFEGFQQYINMIPGLVSLDPSIPQLKRKQFKNLSQQFERNMYQFGQIIIKVFVETCLELLEKYMHDFRGNLSKQSEKKAYVLEAVEEMQSQYNKTIELIKVNYQQLKIKLNQFDKDFQEKANVKMPVQADSEEQRRVLPPDSYHVILNGLVMRLTQDLEKFTVVFLEKHVGKYVILDDDQQNESDENQNSNQSQERLLQFKSKFKLYSHQYVNDFIFEL